MRWWRDRKTGHRLHMASAHRIRPTNITWHSVTEATDARPRDADNARMSPTHLSRISIYHGASYREFAEMLSNELKHLAVFLHSTPVEVLTVRLEGETVFSTSGDPPTVDLVVKLVERELERQNAAGRTSTVPPVDRDFIFSSGIVIGIIVAVVVVAILLMKVL